MGKFLNPFTDVGFKKLFGQEVNKELLIEFLNDLLTGERKVKDITFMDKEIVPESCGGRVVIFDILCKETNGTCFIVEMQNQHQDYYFDRGLYYLCRMISEQGKRGPDWKYEIYPVYGIYFLNFQIPQLPHFRTDIVLADRRTGKQIDGNLRQVYLSLPYFTLEEEECKTDFDRWIYLLKNMDTLDRMPFEARKAVFRKLLEVANIENFTPQERMQYEESLKAYRDYYNTIATAERKAMVKSQHEIATRMKKTGIPVETIAECTGLTIKEINKL